MAYIKCAVFDRHTIKLLDDAKKDDLIDLDELELIDKSNVERIFDEERNANTEGRVRAARLEASQEYEKEGRDADKKHNQDMQDLRNQYDKRLEDLRKEYDEKLADLRKQLNDSNTKYSTDIAVKDNEIKNIKDNAALEADGKYRDEINALKTDKLNLQNQVDGTEDKIKNAVLQKESELNVKIAELNGQLQNAEQSKQSALELQKATLSGDYEQKLNLKQSEIEQLTRARNALNLKQLGNGLEQWCYQEYQTLTSTGAFANCIFEKTTKATSGDDDGEKTMPGYVFRVFSDSDHSKIKLEDAFASVCLEMKTESLVYKDKNKNSDHFKKLDKDRTKQGCQYAILVSELEMTSENDAPIVKVKEYDDMFVVRPQYMIAFISIIYSLAQKYKEILITFQKEKLDLKTRQDIVDQFNKMKKSYLTEYLEKVEKEVVDIQKKATTIQDAANKILESTDKILNELVAKTKEKIEKFEIKKIERKTEKHEKREALQASEESEEGEDSD